MFRKDVIKLDDGDAVWAVAHQSCVIVTSSLVPSFPPPKPYWTHVLKDLVHVHPPTYIKSEFAAILPAPHV